MGNQAASEAHSSAPEQNRMAWIDHFEGYRFYLSMFGFFMYILVGCFYPDFTAAFSILIACIRATFGIPAIVLDFLCNVCKFCHSLGICIVLVIWISVNMLICIIARIPVKGWIAAGGIACWGCASDNLRMFAAAVCTATFVLMCVIGIFGIALITLMNTISLIFNLLVYAVSIFILGCCAMYICVLLVLYCLVGLCMWVVHLPARTIRLAFRCRWRLLYCLICFCLIYALLIPNSDD